MLIKISNAGGNWDNPATWSNIDGSALGRIPIDNDVIVDSATNGNLVINIDTPTVEFYMYNGRVFNLTFNATLNVKGFLYTSSITMLGSFGINCPVNTTLYSDGVTPFSKALGFADGVTISLGKISDFTFAQNSTPNNTLGTEGFGTDDGTYTFPAGWVQDIFTGNLFVDDSLAGVTITAIADGPNGGRRMVFSDTAVGPDSVISKSFNSLSCKNITIEWNELILSGSTNTTYTLWVSTDPTFTTFDILTIPTVTVDDAWHAITPISLPSTYNDKANIYFKWSFVGNGDGTTVIGFDDIRIAGTLFNISITQIHTNTPVWIQTGTIQDTNFGAAINDAYSAAVIADFYINSNMLFVNGISIGGNNNLYLNANITIPYFLYTGRKLKYISGTVSITNLQLQNEPTYNIIVDINPLVVSYVTIINNVTFDSLLTCDTIFLSTDNTICQLLGSFGFDANSFNAGNVINLILADGITYTINNNIGLLTIDNVVHTISSPTGHAKLNIGLNATQTVGCVNLTNIDCSGGLRLNVFGDSTLTNCINVYNIPNSDLPQVYSTF